MTVFAWARTPRFRTLPPPEARLIRVTTDTQVLAHCYWQPRARGRPTLLALHGLEGSSDAHYMRGLADKAWRRGWNAVLLNQRNCGGTEHLTPGLYHSGLTDDPRTVIRDADVGRRPPAVRRRRLLARRQPGASKLAGELARRRRPAGDGRRRRQSDDRARASACARSSGGATIPYQWNFVRNLKARMRRKAARVARAVRSGAARQRSGRFAQFDEVYTAPLTASTSAVDYYHAGERDARRRSHPDSGADSHRRRRSVRAAVAVPRSGRAATIRTSRSRVERARRPLRVRRATARRRRRLLGGDDGREFLGRIGHAVGQAGDVGRRIVVENAFANSGPFPSSSCLKYTNASSHSACLRADLVGPSLEIGRRVAFVAQPEVAVSARWRRSGVVLSPKSAMHSAAPCASSSA